MDRPTGSQRIGHDFMAKPQHSLYKQNCHSTKKKKNHIFNVLIIELTIFSFKVLVKYIYIHIYIYIYIYTQYTEKEPL